MDIHLRVSLEMPRGGLRRVLLYVAAPVAFIAGAGALVHASVPNTFATGDTLSAHKMNDDFANLDQRLSALESHSAPCPAGYTPVGAAPVVCVNGLDQIVRVGSGASAFWVDQFEAVLVEDAGNQPVPDPSALGAAFPQDGQWAGATPAYHAESRAGVQATVKITWFQASTACRAAGKRLPLGSEWLEAARGTIDPGASPGTGGVCVTKAGGPRPTGGGTSCASGWGAEDMIGNLWEWTDEWYAGVGALVNAGAVPWPATGYGGDGTWNLASSAYSDDQGTVGKSIPVAALRGGDWNHGTLDGVFALDLASAPSLWYEDTGFRCVLPR